MRLVILFTEAFSHSACALVEALERATGPVEVVGLGYFFDRSKQQAVQDRLGDRLLAFHNVAALENLWRSGEPSPEGRPVSPEDWARLKVSDRDIFPEFSGNVVPNGLWEQGEPVISRDRFLLGILGLLEKIFAGSPVTATIVYCVAGAWAKALEIVSKQADTAFRTLDFPRIVPDLYFWNDTFVARTPPWIDWEGSRTGFEDEAVRKIIAKAIARVRDRGDLYGDQAKRFVAPRKRKRFPLAAILKATVWEWAFTLRDSARGVSVNPIGWRKPTAGAFWRAQRRLLWRRWRDRCFFAAQSMELGSPPPGIRKTFFFALHFQPEASTMVMAPWHTNQLTVIESIARSLSPDTRLVVKEHPASVGTRPPGFYDAIRRFSAVELLSPWIPSRDVIAASDLIVTMTGTIAMEALIVGKPVVLHGEMYLRELGGLVVYEPDLNKLPEAIDCALQADPVPDDLIFRFFGALLKQSFEFDCLWGDVTSDEIEERGETFDEMARKLIECTPELRPGHVQAV